jgi:hypothetical protein
MLAALPLDDGAGTVPAMKTPKRILAGLTAFFATTLAARRA